MDQKKVAALILKDMYKAFDSLSHEVLSRKLADIGLSESATKWFRSYLTGRSQYVKIGSSKSTPLHITHGVPQGSIYFPLLFSIYTNDLPTAVVNSGLESFVDDSIIFLSFSVQDKSGLTFNKSRKDKIHVIRITSFVKTIY
jgi:hypothetical protein